MLRKTAAEQFAMLRKRLSETTNTQPPLPEKILALLNQNSFNFVDQSDIEGNGTMFQIDYKRGSDTIRFQYNVTRASEITVIINPFGKNQKSSPRYISIDEACKFLTQYFTNS